MQVPRKVSRFAKNDNCEALSPLVMALFDGEADELQTRRARAHLLVCQTCANRWLDWNRARSLLLAVPAPAPPATLVWRVLMACRAASSGRATSSGRAGHAGVAPQPGGAPVLLHEQILARTTRSSPPLAPTSSATSFRNRVFSWPALALPAVALWLLVLQREPLLSSSFLSGATEGETTSTALTAPRDTWLRPTTLSNSAPNPSVRRHLNLIERAASGWTAAPLAGLSAGLSENNRLALKTRRAPLATVNPLAGARTASATVTSAELEQWHQIETLTADASRTEASRTEAARAAFRAAAPRQIAVVLSAPAPFRSRWHAGLASQRPSRILTSAGRGARLSNEPQVPHLRAAQWRLSTPRLTRLIETQAPEVVPSRVSVPAAIAPAPMRLLAENLDADDDRVDEMRSVVDDFRAAVAPEETQNDDDDIG